MRRLQNVNLILLSVAILLSCTDNGNIVRKRVPVIIYESTIPDSGTVNQNIEIQLRAQATNGCYSDFETTLTEIDSKHFLFKATALIGTNGACPSVMVYKDTTITFIASSAGKYYFQTNEDPFKIERDTIEVN